MDLIDFLFLSLVASDTLSAVNAFASLVMAFVLFWLHWYLLKEQRWLLYLSYSYGIYFLQYLFRWLADLVRHGYVDWEVYTLSRELIHVFGSTGTNFFFLTAAVSLLSLTRRGSVLNDTRFKLIAPLILGVLLFHILLTVNSRGEQPWLRIPDAILSLISLSLIGWALYTNIRVGRKFWESSVLAPIALSTGITYGLLNLLFAAVPYFNQQSYFPILYLKLEERIERNQNLIWTVAADKKKPATENSREGSSDTAGYSDPFEVTLSSPGDAIDAAILVFAIPLKFMLFIVTLVPVVRSISLFRPEVFRSTLKNVRHRDQQFFHSEGIVKAIGRSFGADIAQICMRVPGTQKSTGEKRVLWWRWIKRPKESQWPQADLRLGLSPDKLEINHLPSEDSYVGLMLTRGKVVAIPDLSSERKAAHFSLLPDMKSLVAVPIQYHGATIGGITLESQQRSAFSETAILQIQNIADFIAAGLQVERQLGTLDQCSIELPKIELTTPGGAFALSKRAAIVQDALSPMATMIYLDFGFNSFIAGSADNLCVLDRRISKGDESNRRLVTRKAFELALDSYRMDGRHLATGDVRTRKVRLVLVTGGSGRNEHGTVRRIGELVMAYPSKTFLRETGRPMLGESFIHRRTVATIVASTILNAVRYELNSIVNDLQLELSSPGITDTQSLFEAVDNMAHRAGLLWTVAKGPRGTYYGSWLQQKLVRKLMEARREEATADRVSISKTPYKFGHTRHVVSLQLETTGAVLWFGIFRSAFGEELEFHSPWRDFLIRLADTADSALTKLTAEQDMRRMTLDTARTQGMKASLISLGTMTHQLLNFSSELYNGLESIHESIQLGRLRPEKLDKELLKSLWETSSNVRDFLAPFTETTALSDKNPCDLAEVIAVSRRTNSFLIQQGSIEIVTDVEEGMSIAIPGDVITMAISNLITNAAHVMEPGGRISFSATDEGHRVVLRVRDTGPGIDSAIASGIFKPGVTTREDSGGWGLFLTQRSLIENQAAIELTDPGPEGAEFTLYLPKAEKEDR